MFPRRFIKAAVKLGNIQLCVHGEEQCVCLLVRGGWGELKKKKKKRERVEKLLSLEGV